MEGHHVSEDPGDQEGEQQSLPGQPGVQEGWRQKREYQHQRKVEPPLERQDRISLQVRNVDELSLTDDLRVLATHEPTAVREEEPAVRVVRVRVRLRKLVVRAVVAGPLDDVVLEGGGVEERQEGPVGPVGLVGLVCPHPVSPRGNAHARHEVEPQVRDPGPHAGAGGHRERVYGDQVQHANRYYVGPHQLGPEVTGNGTLGAGQGNEGQVLSTGVQQIIVVSLLKLVLSRRHSGTETKHTE